MSLKTSASLGVGQRRVGRAALACLVASALTLSACGDGSSTPQAAAPAATTAASSTTTPLPTTTPPPTTPATRAATTHEATTTPPTTHAAPPPPSTSSPAPATPAPATPAAKPKPAGPAPHAIDETGQLKLDHSPGIGNYYETGTVTGTFDGTMTLHAQIKATGVVVSFTAQIPGGSVTGKGLAIISIVGAAMDPLKGTASITGGTGKYASAHGRGLTVTGKAALDGSKAVVHLTGNVTY